MSFWEKVLNFLIEIVLIPVAALISAAACGVIACIIGIIMGISYDDIRIILGMIGGMIACGLACFGLYKLYYWIRVDAEPIFLLDVLISPLRIVMEIIALLLAFLALFIPPLEPDCRNTDTALGDLFGVDSDSMDFDWGRDGDWGRIGQFFLTLLVILPLAFLDSSWLLFVLFPGSEKYIGLQFSDGGELALILYLVVWWIVHMIYMGVRGHGNRGSLIINLVSRRDGWRGEHFQLTLYGVLLMALSGLTFVTATIGLLLSLFFPTEYSSCGGVFYRWRMDSLDDDEDYPLGWSLLHYLFGLQVET